MEKEGPLALYRGLLRSIVTHTHRCTYREREREIYLRIAVYLYIRDIRTWETSLHIHMYMCSLYFLYIAVQLWRWASVRLLPLGAIVAHCSTYRQCVYICSYLVIVLLYITNLACFV